MSISALTIVGVLVVAGVLGYLWFRRTPVHPSDNPGPANEDTAEVNKE